VSDRIAAAETRAREAEGRARDAEARIADAEHRAELGREAEDRARDAESRARDAETRIAEAEHSALAAHDHGEQLAAQLADLQHRAARVEEASRAGAEAERRIASAEQRVAAAEQRVQAAEQRAQGAEGNAQALARQVGEMQRAQGTEGNAQALARQVAEMQGQIVALEREVANADNVRSFAAETEREIATLQRDLRDTRAKLAQMTLERDRLASEVRDARGDDTTSQRAAVKPGFDPDVTAQVNIAKYESLAAKTSELEQKVQHMERDDAALRHQLAAAEERLRLAAIDLEDDDNERTRTGSQLPIAELAEHVTTLEESINSLRANMRAASDETAMMDPSESVNTISSAVSQAAEHVEVARAAIRALAASIGMS
jgi:chromosome segregation ATPase